MKTRKQEIKDALRNAASRRAIRKYNKDNQGVAFSSFIAGAAWAIRFLKRGQKP